MQDGFFLGGYTPDWWEAARPSRELVDRYNSLPWEDTEGKFKILKKLLGRVDELTVIEPPFRCDDGKRLFLGKNFYANYNLVVLDADDITIGDNVVLGPNVTLCAATHPIHPDSRTTGLSFPIITAPIVIEDDVWLGAGVTVLPGVTIGRGSVVGAHSLVTRDIPPMSVAAGTPCRVIRPINEQDRYCWDRDK